MNPYASIGYGYDSNVFRYDKDLETVPGGRSDQFAVLSAGFESNTLQVSQQQYDFSGEISHTLFSDHSDLDYTGGKFNAIWHWVAGQTLAETSGTGSSARCVTLQTSRASTSARTSAPSINCWRPATSTCREPGRRRTG